MTGAEWVSLHCTTPKSSLNMDITFALVLFVLDSLDNYPLKWCAPCRFVYLFRVGRGKHGMRRTKVHCTIYFKPSMVIAFLNLHTEPHHFFLKTASWGHSIETSFDFKGRFLFCPLPAMAYLRTLIGSGRNSALCQKENEGKN